MTEDDVHVPPGKVAPEEPFELNQEDTLEDEECDVFQMERVLVVISTSLAASIPSVTSGASASGRATPSGIGRKRTAATPLNPKANKRGVTDLINAVTIALKDITNREREQKGEDDADIFGKPVANGLRLVANQGGHFLKKLLETIFIQS
eukprot:gene2813-1040_t